MANIEGEGNLEVQAPGGKKAEVWREVILYPDSWPQCLQCTFSAIPHAGYSGVSQNLISAEETISIDKWPENPAMGFIAGASVHNSPSQSAKVEIEVEGRTYLMGKYSSEAIVASSSESNQTIEQISSFGPDSSPITIDIGAADGSDSSEIKAVITYDPNAKLLALFRNGICDSICQQPQTGLTSLNLKGHIEGTIAITYTAVNSAGTVTKGRSSNGGAIMADLNDNVDQGSVSGSATFYVDQAWGGKIQSAVDAAWDGDTIYVAAGNYKENVVIDKSITIIGAGSANTIVDGNQAGAVFAIGTNNPYISVALSGMTIQNSKAEQGGGIYNAYGIITVSGCTISENIANYNGGGICTGFANSESINLIIENCDISKNRAQWGGGIMAPAATITNCNITKNVATTESGGGMYLTGVGTTQVTGCTISENTAYVSGGGIFVNSGALIVENSNITNNTAGYGGGIGNGGGIFIISTTEGPASIEVTGSNISENTATGNGGGIYNVGATLQPPFDTNQVVNNRPDDIVNA